MLCVEILDPKYQDLCPDFTHKKLSVRFVPAGVGKKRQVREHCGTKGQNLGPCLVGQSKVAGWNKKKSANSTDIINLVTEATVGQEQRTIGAG